MNRFNQVQQVNTSLLDELAFLDEATKSHNAKFDEAKEVFANVEQHLRNIGIEYWHPAHLIPPTIPTIQPFTSMPIYGNIYQPFEVKTYLLGFSDSRLQIKTVTTSYDYMKYPNGQLAQNLNGIPLIYVVSQEVTAPIPVTDSSRALRIMVIQHLPVFLNVIKQSVMQHTETLSYALNQIRV